jgi:predicted amidophosphoribosyltransferase
MSINIAKLIHIIANIFFPHLCVGCQRPGQILCLACQKKLKPYVEDQAENIISVFSYQDKVVKNVIWHLKYKRADELADILAPVLKSQLAVFYSESYDEKNKKLILVPVPMHKSKIKARGQDHVLVLARAIEKLDPENIVMAKLIVKTKNTKSQVACRDRNERLGNLAGAFLLRKNTSSLFLPPQRGRKTVSMHLIKKYL